MAANLGVTPDDFYKTLRVYVDPNPASGPLTAAFFEDLPPGYLPSSVLEMFRGYSCAQKPNALREQADLTPALYHDLTGRDTVALTGRVRGRASRWEKLTLVPRHLADAALKAAAYAAVVEGWHLVAVTGNELVFEFSADDDLGAIAERVIKHVCSTGAEVLSSIPVECKTAWLSEW
jgi:hypothetical protein